MTPQSTQVPLPDGLARATVFMPLPDPLGIPEGRYLLIGDPEFDELVGEPVVVGDVALKNTEGRTPIELEVWRIDSTESAPPAINAAHKAYQRSRFHLQEADSQPESESSKILVTTVVVGVTIIVRVATAIPTGDPVGRAIEIIQRLQLGYLTSVGGPPIERLSLERLPVLIPLVSSPGPPAPPSPGNVGMFFTRPYPSSPDFSWPLLADQQIHQVFANTGFAPFMIGRPFFEFRNDAQVQLHRYGNYRQSVIATAAACENLVLTLIELLLWEEGVDPPDAIPVVASRDGIVRITARELPPRLRGVWNPNLPGPIKNWRDQIVKQRNAVVHGGQDVQRNEALAALSATEGLLEFIGVNHDRKRPREMVENSSSSVV
jgi:hypothetical protein